MPKTINTPREELICGKLDLLVELIREDNKVDAIYLIEDIRHDAQRMESKLILRKQEHKRQQETIAIFERKMWELENKLNK